MIDTVNENALVVPIEERLGVEEVVSMIMYFNSDGIEEYNEMVSVLVDKGSYIYAPMK